eukprot:s3034_g11.t1
MFDSRMLLHMTEYTSFSSLMRAKVQQKKFIREMERRKQDANVLSSVARSMTSRNRPLERTGAHLAVQ